MLKSIERDLSSPRVRESLCVRVRVCVCMCMSIYLRDKFRPASQLLQYQSSDIRAFLMDRHFLADQDIVLCSERQVILKSHTQR